MFLAKIEKKYRITNISDCPVKIIENSVVKTLLSVSYLPKESLSGLYIKNSKRNGTHSFENDNQRNRLEPSALSLHKDEDIDPEDFCIPRFQLARVKHPQSFSEVYLLQVRKKKKSNFNPIEKLNQRFHLNMKR